MALASEPRTARLSLRPLAAADAAAVVAMPGETSAIHDARGLAGTDRAPRCKLAPQAQGQGYATEAARCLVAAFFAGGGEVLHSGHFEGNKPSARVLAKLGFAETGRDRRFCTALGHDRPHVNLSLPRAAFS